MFQQVVLQLVVLLASLEHKFGDAATNTAENIASAGFEVETHHVTTPDGYILEMHRIPYARFQTAASGSGPRPVVFLQHGMFSASNVFIGMGTDLSVAYNLADVGCDVWMGNHRGTKPSRRHVSLNPDDRTEKMNFFDFSWDEVGTIDMPTMIDYVLEHTGKDKLHYVGHSQGGTTFLVMASIRTEYNDKIASAHLFAGVGNMNYFPDAGLTTLAQLTDTIYTAARFAGLTEVLPPNSTEFLGRSKRGTSRLDHCLGDIKYKDLCEAFGLRKYLIETEDETEADTEAGNEITLNDSMGGGSLKQIAHYGQNIRDRSFRRWNYGNRNNNMAQYGTPEPPIYDLSLITINTTMHYSLNDTLLDERDVLEMAAVMPNTVARKVARESFDHMDYVQATDAKELVTDNVIESILYMESIISDDSDQDQGNVDVEEEVIDEIDELPVAPAPIGPTDSASVAYSSTMTMSVLVYCLYTYLV